MVDGANVMAAHDFEQLRQIPAVDTRVRTCIHRCSSGSHAHVRGDDAVFPVAVAQGDHELGSDLTESTCHEEGSRPRSSIRHGLVLSELAGAYEPALYQKVRLFDIFPGLPALALTITQGVVECPT